MLNGPRQRPQAKKNISRRLREHNIQDAFLKDKKLIVAVDGGHTKLPVIPCSPNSKDSNVKTHISNGAIVRYVGYRELMPDVKLYIIVHENREYFVGLAHVKYLKPLGKRKVLTAKYK